jgi:hypothetical protein
LIVGGGDGLCGALESRLELSDAVVAWLAEISTGFKVGFMTGIRLWRTVVGAGFGICIAVGSWVTENFSTVDAIAPWTIECQYMKSLIHQALTISKTPIESL